MRTNSISSSAQDNFLQWGFSRDDPGKLYVVLLLPKAGGDAGGFCSVWFLSWNTSHIFLILRLLKICRLLSMHII